VRSNIIPKAKVLLLFSPPLSLKKGGNAADHQDKGEEASDEEDSEGTCIGIAAGGGNGFIIGASTPHFAARLVYHCLSSVSFHRIIHNMIHDTMQCFKQFENIFSYPSYVFLNF